MVVQDLYDTEKSILLERFQTSGSQIYETM